MVCRVSGYWCQTKDFLENGNIVKSRTSGSVTMLNRNGGSPGDRIVDVVQRLLTERSISRPVRSDDDLREVGLTSLDMVNLMLSVEAEFDLEIPEVDITTANFRSISTISSLVTALLNNV
jgi:acyl carrier protein